MNEHFEYMTGYAVLIVRAYIKMGVFLNSSVTTIVPNADICNPPSQHTHETPPLLNDPAPPPKPILLKVNVCTPIPTPPKNNQPHSTPRDRRLAIHPAL